jgi:hypothetical protein
MKSSDNQNKKWKASLLNIAFIFILVFTKSVSFAQATSSPSQDPKQGTRDKEFTSLFERDCCGVTGADGIYSVLLPDGRSVWIFGDSFLGTVGKDFSRNKQIPWFVRNAMAVQEADTLRSLYQVINGWESSLVIPPGSPKGKQFSEDSLWYWPGDGFIENGKLKVFMSGFYQAKPGDWGFAWCSANIATFSLPDLTLEYIDHFSYPGETEIHWGHAVCHGDEKFTYIYGAENKTKNLYVARAPKGNILGPWEFYTGSEWVSDSKKAGPMLAIQGSEQFSVFKYKDHYVLVVQEGGFLTRDIVSYYSDNPYKDWKNRKVLCQTIYPEGVKSTENLFMYNSLAHPQFIKNDEILLSTCINSFVVEDVFKDARKYRPVFQRVPIRWIFEE